MFKHYLKISLLSLVIILAGCSKEETSESAKNANASLFFNLQHITSQNRQSIERLPDCSDATPAYAEVRLTGTENIGSVASPKKINFSSNTETEALQLSEGTYDLEYFAVYDADDQLIWVAPTEDDHGNFVENPLPKTINITAYESQELEVEVVCFENRVLTDPDAITAKQYVQQLGAGFDVTYAEFNKYINWYQEQVNADFADAGFTNVRIRMNDEDLDDEFIGLLKQRVDDALKYNINPILAYQGHYLEETATTDEEARQHLVEWWRKMAQEFQDYPPEVAFNIMVEISGRYKNDAEAMNSFYADVYDAIRETNPSRIIIFPPVNISNPDNLSELEIPGGADPYTMAEWHFYAAGPNQREGSKKYWIDGSTAEERQNILDPITTAVNWMNETGNVSWVGAWMPGNYNKGNDYTVEEQVGIASYITRQLNMRDIPFSVNAGNKFYDYENLKWFDRTTDVAGKPVREAILDSEKAAVYTGVDYASEPVRLAAGDYQAADLTSLGIYENIQSVMVPFDFEVILYNGDDLSGDSMVLDITSRDLGSFTVRSMNVTYKNSY